MTKQNRQLKTMRNLRLGLAFVICGAAFSQVNSVFAQETWTKTKTGAHPTKGAVFHQYLPEGTPVDIAVTLKLRNRDTLDKHVRALTQPGNPEFGKWMSREKILADYAPLPDRAKAVVDYLIQAGFTDVEVAPNRMLVTASGTTRSVRKAFHTELGHFTKHGRSGVANTMDVQIPAELGDTVLSVLGLQTLDQMHPMSMQAQSVQLTGSVHGINPVNFPVAYNAAGLPSASTISVGIITEGSMTQTITDLHTFESQNGLPAINPTVVNAWTSGTSTDTSGTAEWNLDSQSIQGMAGGQVKQMVFYVAKSFTDANITKALNRAVSDNIVSVINVSLGLCESAAQSDGSLAADDQIFQTAIAQGQTFSVSTGDSGSSECVNAQGAAIPGASYPASSPYVIAVGGTTLYTNGDGSYGGELVWSGTGGSPSLIEAKPVWQNGVVTGAYRGLPDIAFAADPNSGAIIIVNGGNQQWGGTSLASPLFVGSWARIQAANNAKLGFPATWIYSRGAQNTPAFHDVTSGSNGAYSATTGWDYTTGFGSFDVAATTLLTRSSVAVSASPATIFQGQSVTLTATVSGNAPTGTVQFQVNGVNIGSPVPLVNGVATLTTTLLTTVGSDAITAIYSGDANNAGGGNSAAFNETVKSIHDGDINGDGVVDARDVMFAEQLSSGQLTATPTQLTHGDVAPLVNGVPTPDGKIDVRDVLMIERKASGLQNF